MADKKTKAMVLGCGLVGATIARDLADGSDYEVTVVDISEENLRKVAGLAPIQTKQADLGDCSAVGKLVDDQDVVLGALPSRIGFQMLRMVIEHGKPYCDISFMPENALQLDDLAKKHGVTAITDCGVSPGLSNWCVGRGYALLDHTQSAVIYVGGLPKVRLWPFDYKAPFAPADVLEVYTRPARIVENGATVVVPPLSDPELLDFPETGTLEACNTDGLRSLADLLDIPNMKEKTLRYPGHFELIRALSDTGFFSKEVVDVKGVAVRPLDLTAALLFPKWKLDEDEEEFTVMRVVVKGTKDGKVTRITYDLYDEYDRTRRMTSMARTTGFPCTIVAGMIVNGKLNKPGVFAPEQIADQPHLYDTLVRELQSRGVVLTETVQQL